MDAEKYLAPMVAGALGFVSGHVIKLDTTVSLAIGGVSAVAGYIASNQDCSRRRKKVVENDYEEDEDDFDSEEVPQPTKTKKKKKKKHQMGKMPKAFKKSSYEEEAPPPPPQPKKETEVDEEYRGLSKNQIKKLRRKKREEEKKAAEAKALAEAKKMAKKRRKKKKKKQNTDVEVEDEATRLAREEKERRKKEEEEGWQQPKEHIKRERQKQEFERTKAILEANKAAPKSQMYIKVPPSQRGKVFGKKAANINLLQNLFDVKMTLPKQGGVHDVVAIEGTEDSCEKAVKALQDIMDKGYSSYTNPGFAHAVVPVPPNKIGVMMGTAGKNFRDIVKITKVTTLEKDEDAKIITIVGPAPGVDAAKEALEELAAQGYSKITHPSWMTAELPMNSDVVPAIIGKKGANIQRITKATHTRITTPKNGSNTCIVVGDEKNVKLAIEMLQKTIEEQNAPKEPEPTPPEWQGVQEHNEEDLWN